MFLVLPSHSQTEIDNYKPIFIGAVYQLHSDTLVIVTELIGLPVVGFASGRLVGQRIKFILQRGGSKTEEFNGYWQFINDREIVSIISDKGKTEYLSFIYTKPLSIKERLQ